MKREELLEIIKQSIIAVNPTAKVILFGSRARGDFRPSSDWDILILVDTPKLTSEDKDKLFAPIYDIELETGEPINPIFHTLKEWRKASSRTPFYHNVINEGVTL